MTLFLTKHSMREKAINHLQIYFPTEAEGLQKNAETQMPKLKEKEVAREDGLQYD